MTKYLPNCPHNDGHGRIACGMDFNPIQPSSQPCVPLASSVHLNHRCTAIVPLLSGLPTNDASMTMSMSIPFLLSFLVFPFFHYSQPQYVALVTGPVSLPERNVSLNEPIVGRGVALAVGPPPQDLAFDIQRRVLFVLLFEVRG